MEILLEKIEYTLGSRLLKFDNILEVVTMLMKAVEIMNLSGPEKKKLVIDTVKIYVDTTTFVKDPVIEAFIDKMLVQVIDNFIEIDKGNLKFNTKSCCMCF